MNNKNHDICEKVVNIGEREICLSCLFVELGNPTPLNQKKASIINDIIACFNRETSFYVVMKSLYLLSVKVEDVLESSYDELLSEVYYKYPKTYRNKTVLDKMFSNIRMRMNLRLMVDLVDTITDNDDLLKYTLQNYYNSGFVGMCQDLQIYVMEDIKASIVSIIQKIGQKNVDTMETILLHAGDDSQSSCNNLEHLFMFLSRCDQDVTRIRILSLLLFILKFDMLLEHFEKCQKIEESIYSIILSNNTDVQNLTLELISVLLLNGDVSIKTRLLSSDVPDFIFEILSSPQGNYLNPSGGGHRKNLSMESITLIFGIFNSLLQHQNKIGTENFIESIRKFGMNVLLKMLVSESITITAAMKMEVEIFLITFIRSVKANSKDLENISKTQNHLSKNLTELIEYYHRVFINDKVMEKSTTLDRKLKNFEVSLGFISVVISNQKKYNLNQITRILSLLLKSVVLIKYYFSVMSYSKTKTNFNDQRNSGLFIRFLKLMSVVTSSFKSLVSDQDTDKQIGMKAFCFLRDILKDFVVNTFKKLLFDNIYANVNIDGLSFFFCELIQYMNHFENCVLKQRERPNKKNSWEVLKILFNEKFMNIFLNILEYSDNKELVRVVYQLLKMLIVSHKLPSVVQMMKVSKNISLIKTRDDFIPTFKYANLTKNQTITKVEMFLWMIETSFCNGDFLSPLNLNELREAMVKLLKNNFSNHVNHDEEINQFGSSILVIFSSMKAEFENPEIIETIKNIFIKMSSNFIGRNKVINWLLKIRGISKYLLEIINKILSINRTLVVNMVNENRIEIEKKQFFLNFLSLFPKMNIKDALGVTFKLLENNKNNIQIIIFLMVSLKLMLVQREREFLVLSQMGTENEVIIDTITRLNTIMLLLKKFTSSSAARELTSIALNLFCEICKIILIRMINGRKQGGKVANINCLDMLFKKVVSFFVSAKENLFLFLDVVNLLLYYYSIFPTSFIKNILESSRKEIMEKISYFKKGMKNFDEVELFVVLQFFLLIDQYFACDLKFTIMMYLDLMGSKHMIVKNLICKLFLKHFHRLDENQLKILGEVFYLKLLCFLVTKEEYLSDVSLSCLEKLLGVFKDEKTLVWNEYIFNKIVLNNFRVYSGQKVNSDISTKSLKVLGFFLKYDNLALNNKGREFFNPQIVKKFLIQLENVNQLNIDHLYLILNVTQMFLGYGLISKENKKVLLKKVNVITNKLRIKDNLVSDENKNDLQKKEIQIVDEVCIFKKYFEKDTNFEYANLVTKKCEAIKWYVDNS